MPTRKVVVLQSDLAWNQYLQEVFDDTSTTLQIFHSPQEALPFLRQERPDVVFAHPNLLSATVVAALEAQRVLNRQFRAFSLGNSSENRSYRFDETFPEIPLDLYTFQRKLVQHLPLPETLRLLIVDDEPGVIELFRDYFEHRKNPTFILRTAADGVEGEALILNETPDVLILDIKMPRKDGREVYRSLKTAGKLPPTIVFFDAVSAEDVLEIRRWGKPAFVEKGSRASGMPDMAALVKKLAYFG